MKNGSETTTHPLAEGSMRETVTLNAKVTDRGGVLPRAKGTEVILPQHLVYYSPYAFLVLALTAQLPTRLPHPVSTNYRWSERRVSGPGQESHASFTHENWFRRTAGEWLTLVDLPENWNSYGAPPIDGNAIKLALEILQRSMQPDSPPPSVVPTSRGGVQLEWHRDGIDIEVEVAPEGDVTMTYDNARSGDEWEAEQIQRNPEPLQRALRNLARLQ
jgi:hypothetical protein